MNTFNDMRNKIIELYKESFEEFPEIKEMEEDSDIDSIGIDESDDEFNRKIYIVDAIISMEENEKDDLICLLILYYYSYMSTEDDVFDDELINIIKKGDKDTILSLIGSNESTFLYDLISILLEEDIFIYESDIGQADDYDFYTIMNEALKNKTTKRLYQLYHPNLNEEAKHYNMYIKNEKLLDKYSNIKIKSLDEFIKNYSIVSKLFTSSSYINSFLSIVLYELKQTNNKLFMEINLFMIRYYYIKNYIKNNQEFEYYRYTSFLATNEINNYSYGILNEFIDFDLVKTLYMYSLLPSSIKVEIHSMLSLSNIETYGEDGILREYKSGDGKLICKYAILWKGFIENNHGKNKALIYYSKNKDGEYKIPRFCLIVNDKNELLDILGRDENLCIEFSMIDKLESEIKKYNNSDKTNKYLYDLRLLRSIKNKIEKNNVLSNDEINILCEINYNLSKDLLGHYDYRFEQIKYQANEKKLLATYFNCKESQVALNHFELDENTVVSSDVNLYDEVCNYPNLKVILGDLSAREIESAEGFKSLEFVRGNIYFNSLISSYGLSNLIRVDGNMNLESMEDTSYLNKNILVKGKIIFKDNEKYKQFKKEK